MNSVFGELNLIVCVDPDMSEVNNDLWYMAFRLQVSDALICDLSI